MTAIRLAALAIAALFALPVLAHSAAPPNVATFSVVAYDPSTGEVGVAVQSKFFAVGSVVPYCKAGVGAVATQAFAQPEYGPLILEKMASKTDFTPSQAIRYVLLDDDQASQRQIGVVGIAPFVLTGMPVPELPPPVPGKRSGEGNSTRTNAGSAATYTGTECLNWAGGKTGVTPDGVVYAVQGNILTGPEVVGSMAAAMDDPGSIVLPGAYANGQVGIALHTRDFAGRLLGALVAGQLAGGDSRGMQSSALLVKQAGAGYGGYTDVKYDLRVDDAEDPFMELARLLNIARPIQLTFAGYRELEAGNMDEAIRIFTDLATIEPGNASHRYNLACGLARARRADEAMVQLRLALELDEKLRDLAKSDPDLESLRERTEFKELVNMP